MKRKATGKTSIALMAGLLICAPLYTSAEEASGFARCEEYINVRENASAESAVTGKLYNNNLVTILGSSEDGTWYHIRSGNVDGYAAAEYIVTGEDAEELADEAGYTTAEVGAWALNVRAERSTDSEIVGTVYEDQEYEVVDDQGDWIKVVTGDGTYGWVSSDYVYTSTEYGTGETLEEEQARLDEAWLNYLASQEAEAQADSSQQGTGEEAYAQAQAYQDAADQAQTQADAAFSAADEAQAQAEAEYQAYLDAQAEADAAAQAAADEAALQTAAEAQAQADEALQIYEEAAQAAEEAAMISESEQAAADEAAQAAEAAYEEAVNQEASYEENSYEENSYEDNSYEETSYEEVSAEDTASVSTGSATGQAVADYACQFVGNPYVYGGSSLTGGADCSGFVMSVYANFGVSLPHNAAAQSGCGTSVDASSLAPGDLVFYSDGSGISHVAIYIGSGSIVHAANSSSGICYGSLNYNTPVAYRRLV